ncbi:UDP-glucuronosyl/UDP-glucosyltransferase [Artemisia annua]|uniref:UDP-glucuronosyl/UDP-glucosyltransferase n=1 Tax=Artemisia annua TaxID=35608 RepID=A0A2U1MD82_ARTAN|nr:UDP-glucuronosyl/UDP-glucosyltransferase [Artemisia annua]
MSLQDLLEFGWGLVNSNQYFLWIIRTNLVDGKPVVLPEELKEEIKARGFIASYLSAGVPMVCWPAGVPMVCWPDSHDQRVNCIQMCKKWEVGMELEGNVKRVEVEKRVRELMEGIEGKRMKKKVFGMEENGGNSNSVINLMSIGVFCSTTS